MIAKPFFHPEHSEGSINFACTLARVAAAGGNTQILRYAQDDSAFCSVLLFLNCRLSVKVDPNLGQPRANAILEGLIGHPLQIDRHVR